jgi:Ohr subfamily peroxiredoxin
MSAKVMYTGKTHNTPGRDGGTRSSDGMLDLRLPEPHPAAENLFGAAWSACYMAAVGLVAGQRKVKLPPDFSIDTTIELLMEAGAFFLRARMDVALPGMDRAVAQELLDAAHKTCPYSKAVHGNIEVVTNLL